MREPIQLISPLWGPLATQAAAQVLSDTNTDFLVIGVCSSEHDISRTLVSTLVGTSRPAAAGSDSRPQHLPGLQMQVVPRDRVIVLDASAMLSPALLSALLASNRPQPAVGSTAAAAVRAAAKRAGSGGSIPVEGVALLLQLQLLVFLFATCNMVVISSDRFDTDLLQLLEAAGLIATSIPSMTLPPGHTLAATAAAAGEAATAAGKHPRRTPQQQQQQQRRSDLEHGTATSSHSGSRRRQQRQPPQQLMSDVSVATEVVAGTAAVPAATIGASLASTCCHVADLVLLQCCSSQQQLSHAWIQQLQQLVHSCLHSTPWAFRPQQIMPLHFGAAGEAPHETRQQAPTQAARKDSPDGISGSSSNNSGVGVLVWATPQGSKLGHAGRSFRPPQQLQQLSNQLLKLPRTTTNSNSSSSTAAGRGSSGAFSRVMTESEWLRAAERVWDAVQDSPELLQYYRTAAEARFAGAGGWSPALPLRQHGSVSSRPLRHR